MIVCFLIAAVQSKLVQAACLLHTSKSEFNLKFVDVHKQNGSNDCGVFSIAYAVALCLGEYPGTLVFEQTMMRIPILCRVLSSNAFPFFQSKAKEGEKI